MKLSLVSLIVGIHCIVMTRQESDYREIHTAPKKCSAQFIDMRMKTMDLYQRLNEYCGITTTTATTTTQATTTMTTPSTTTPMCSDVPDLVTLYQEYSSTKMDHYLLTDTTEVTAAEAMGYIAQPSPGKVTLASTCPCAMSALSPVYRLFNSNSNDHFYTTSIDEANYAKTLGYVQEKVAFNCSPTKGLCGATLPLFRLRNNGDHIYVTDPSQAVGDIFEGITCYKWPS